MTAEDSRGDHHSVVRHLTTISRVFILVSLGALPLVIWEYLQSGDMLGIWGWVMMLAGALLATMLADRGVDTDAC